MEQAHIDSASAESDNTEPQSRQLVLLLTTQGRYSGRAETSCLPFRRQRGDFLVVASNEKSRTKPDWYLNLKEEPIVQVEMGGATFYARATTPTGNDRLKLFPIIREMVDFSDRVPRETAAVLLTPLC